MDDIVLPSNFNVGLGSCMLATEILTKLLLKNGVTDFNVIEGYITFPNAEWKEQHTWIEKSNGEIIDKTTSQWGHDGSKIIYLYENRREYSPEEYLSICKKFPVEESRYIRKAEKDVLNIEFDFPDNINKESKYQRAYRELNENGEAIMQCFGDSMEPALRSGCYITFKKFPGYEVKDIVFCVLNNGAIIDAHRIIKKVEHKGKIWYLIAGEDGTVNGWTNRVFGKVVKVEY